jgi:hypothetical protein
MSEFSIQLEARAPALGRWRAYRVEAGRDLFGSWVVATTFGRIGSSGRTLFQAAPSEADARRLVVQSLRRRASAPRRIGFGYRQTEVRDPLGWMNQFPLPELASRERQWALIDRV